MSPEPLSAHDASFLALEREATPMHTGGLSVFEPGLAFGDVARTLSARIAAVPLARRRLQRLPLGAGTAWVADPDFEVSFHLRHATLPAPGDAAQLHDLLARLMARPLDRRRPLWELYVVDGLQGGRVALFRKVHLAAAGAEHGDVFAVLLDDEPDVAPPQPVGSPGPTIAGPAPSARRLAAEVLLERAGRVRDAGDAVRRVALAPPRLLRASVAAAGSALGLAARLARQAPPTPLNATLTSRRRFATARVDLDDLRLVRRVFGGTINDAVVSVVADAVGRLLRRRGHDTTDLDLRVMVPVRVRSTVAAEAGDAVAMRDGVVGVLAPLPVMEIDPVSRLYRVMGELAGIEGSREAVAADDLVRLAGYAPPTLHGLAARLASAEQRYNVALSNAPGPQQPRYLAGRRLLETYPVIPLAGDAALSVAVSSYAGRLYFGLLGDRAAMPDLDLLALFVGDAVAGLVDAARGHEPSR